MTDFVDSKIEVGQFRFVFPECIGSALNLENVSSGPENVSGKSEASGRPLSQIPMTALIWKPLSCFALAWSVWSCSLGDVGCFKGQELDLETNCNTRERERKLSRGINLRILRAQPHGVEE